ncbi:MAG: class I SAM-dependent methyltransferase [Burkholderiales bacterium]
MRRRTRLAQIYRRMWLYPKLCSNLEGRALDVGCGIGDMLRYRPNTVGVDINPLAVDWCRAQGFEAYPMNPDNLPFEDGAFESVVLDNVLEHLTNPLPLLHEIRRVLAGSGLLIVGVPGHRGFASDPDHKIFYDETLMQQTLDRVGFTCECVFYMPLPFQSVWLSRRTRQYCIYGVFRRN